MEPQPHYGKSIPEMFKELGEVYDMAFTKETDQKLSGMSFKEPIRLDYRTRRFSRKSKLPISLYDMIRLIGFYGNRYKEMNKYAR